MFKDGKDSDIKPVLDNILVAGKTVYMFSLTNKVIDSGVYGKKGKKELKNKDLIPLEDIILLECQVVEYDKKIVTLKFIKTYDIFKGVYPIDGCSKLVELTS